MPVRSQTFDSSGPDVRIRGNAYQVLEKYLALARDATAAGDRIAAENFYQHAEHYYRLINANGGDHRRHDHGHGQQDSRAAQAHDGQANGSAGPGAQPVVPQANPQPSANNANYPTSPEGAAE